MPEVIPLWKSHYSISRSILSLEKKRDPKEPKEIGPDSIIDLCLENNIKHVFLVEDGFSSFLEAHLNCKDAGLKLSFGLRITFVHDLNDKTDEATEKSCKYVIFAKNEAGYKRLIKLFAIANQVGYYYVPRLDFKTLAENWSDKDLLLAIPFYDSFLHKNYFSGHICLPDFSKIKPVFFWEDNDLPFDDQLKKRVFEYAGSKYEIQEAKSIYYNKREDYLSYVAFRCISSRATLEKPELTNMCSAEFCLESYLERIKS